LIEDDTAWSPYLSPDDALKLDTVRLALRRGDLAEAAFFKMKFRSVPISCLITYKMADLLELNKAARTPAWRFSKRSPDERSDIRDSF
jgi:hypothetical protein